ncbi:hypothetical protein PGSY75_1139600 [Plasmodium gaboni]|uniref:Uncharacterized protein n=1 Tax=Plasmodium gaboni TaxID=647221 RepID=A0A151LJA8_9APIC|nr:hypothetical protein PGSY75_1139600 [Plasmodium gaboni]KYN99031.1 hypothetical protein PGSY75_1139600 [Plasmodium gaboni]
MEECYTYSSTEDNDRTDKLLRKKTNINDFNQFYILHDKNKECSKHVEKNLLGNLFISKKIKNEEDSLGGSKELCRTVNDTLTSNYFFNNNKQNISEITPLDKNINILNSMDQQNFDDEEIILYNIRRMYESNTKYCKHEETENINSNISNVDCFKYNNNIYQKNSEYNSSTNESDIFQSVRSSKSYNDIFTQLNKKKKKNKKNKFINDYENMINIKRTHMNNIGDIKNQPLEKYSEGFMKKEKMEVASLSFKSLSDDENNYSFIQTFNHINQNKNQNIYKKENKKNMKYNNKHNDDTKKKFKNSNVLPTNFLLSQKDIKKCSVTNNEKLEKEEYKDKINMLYIKNNILHKNTMDNMKKQNKININKFKMTNSILKNVHLKNLQENDTIKNFSEKNIEKYNESIEKNKLYESLKHINKSLIRKSSICSYDKLENFKNNFTQIKKNGKNNTYTIDKKLENSSSINKYKSNNFSQDKGIYDGLNKYNTFSTFKNYELNNTKVVSSLDENKSQNIITMPKEKDSNVTNNLHIQKYTYNQHDNNKNVKYMYNLKDPYNLKKVNTKSIGVQINVKKKTSSKKTNTVNIFYLDHVKRKKIPKIKFKTITQIYNYDFDAIIVKDGHIISRKKDPLKELFQNFYQKV